MRTILKMKRILFFLALLSIFTGAFFVTGCAKTEEAAPTQTKAETETLPEETETLPTLPTETREEEEAMPKTPLMKGIDVSKWQGQPDWKGVAADGVEFAMIRIGFHGSSGNFGEDPSADYNLKSANENGILTGVYFYSLAKDPAEAEAEAAWVLERVGKYAISLPIVIDYEMMENDAAATAAERTEIALAFLRKVRDAGYDAMIYVPIEEINDGTLWEKERIFDEFKVWGADYDLPAEALHPDGVSDYAMWQYSNTGRIRGISGNVDLNYAYFTAEYAEPREKTEEPEDVQNTPAREFNQTFAPANRKVTAKIEVNLRKTPSIDGEVVGSLKKGEFVLCTGDSDMGWSRLDYKGERVFAVTSYLMDENGNGIVPSQSFASADGLVTAKDVVNLRLAPSTDAEIAGTLKNGETLRLTGIGDKGWSRLDYNGVSVYAVSSYLQKV